jgi:hypothetical protein
MCHCVIRQCFGCRDWFHGSCIHSYYDFEADEFDHGEDYFCVHCLSHRESIIRLIHPG